MVMNILDNQKLASYLVSSKDQLQHGEPDEEEVNEDAHYLDMTKEVMSAFKENKPEKALRALKMLVECIYEDIEEEDDEYDGMKYAEKES